MADDILDEIPSRTEVNETYLRAFFVRQSDYYLEKYYDYLDGRHITFNIASFLCGVFWMLYRKLFREFLLCIVLLIALEGIQFLVTQTLGLSEAVDSAVTWFTDIAIWFAFGFTGNYLYMRHCDEKIRKVLSTTEDEETRLQLLSEKGGISYSPFVVLCGIILIVIILVNQ